MPDLTVDAPRRLVVSRVGYKPEPWAWVGWEWATAGRFHGRWDHFDGNFRTIYAGSPLLACLERARIGQSWVGLGGVVSDLLEREVGEFGGELA